MRRLTKTVQKVYKEKTTIIPLLQLAIFCFSFLTTGLNCYSKNKSGFQLFPANGQKNVNPDVQLKITFDSQPILGNSGMIRVYDAETGKLVDVLDMSIPPGPRNTRTPAPYDSMQYNGIPDSLYTVYNPDKDSTHIYQINYIGGTSPADAFHYYPVQIHDREAVICLHNNHLEYNTTYYVQIDQGVLSLTDGSFQGITDHTSWTFSTKPAPPSTETEWLVVSSDGTGDFNTVQGALDFIPEENPVKKIIFIKKGRYEEIVFFKNKENIMILGEDRQDVVICYANNSVFNSRFNILATHNTRSVLATNDTRKITISNLTLLSLGEKPAQAEGLLVKGEEIMVSDVNILGSGDALQATGQIYLKNCKIRGFGDNVLGYGSVFFDKCEFVTTYGPHLWPRNSDKNHGNILYKCILRSEGDASKATIARAPIKSHYSFPYSEAVLINCALEGVLPIGWGETDSLCLGSKCWEYNSVNLSDGKPVDVSQRAHYSRQLTMEKDSAIIANYSDPAFVLDGWKPALLPIIVLQPKNINATKGQDIDFSVKAYASEEVKYQWFKNGAPLTGETKPALTIQGVKKRDNGNYSVQITSSAGPVISEEATLTVN